MSLAGPVLTAEERDLLARGNPFGVILFRRNIETPAQVLALTDSLRAATGRPDLPILIDEEGGRVARLRGPDWSALPAARRFGLLAERTGIAAARPALLAVATLLAARVLPLGIGVVCTPVCDVLQPDTDNSIGDRAYSGDPAIVAACAGIVAEGLLRHGVLPVVKHMPGLGRGRVDSHAHLPLVDAPLQALQRVDFAPFRDLAALPLGMVGHACYAGLDRRNPASQSRLVIGAAIREQIGFNGLLFSDDIAMDALRGDAVTRAQAVLAAGCDVALHCNGRLAESRALVAAIPFAPGLAEAWDALIASLKASAPVPPSPDEVAAAWAALKALDADADEAVPPAAS